jgi:hypothetical protein
MVLPSLNPIDQRRAPPWHVPVVNPYSALRFVICENAVMLLGAKSRAEKAAG